MDYKAGDYIHCHTTGHMNQNGSVFAYAGESYEVTQADGDMIWFIDAAGESHRWRMVSDIDSFRKFFRLKGEDMEPTRAITKHKFV